METIKFKTNINCGNCIAKVTPFLDKKAEIFTWSVDIESPDKILTVETEELTAQDIIKIVRRTGFEAELI